MILTIAYLANPGHNSNKHSNPVKANHARLDHGTTC